MAWRSDRNGPAIERRRGRSGGAALALVLAAAGLLCEPRPAAAQIGGWSEGARPGRAAWPRPGVGRSPRGGDGGPVWGGGRRPNPGPILFPFRIEPRAPRYLEEEVVVRRRAPPPEIAVEVRTAPKSRPAARKRVVREAAAPPARTSAPPARTRPKPARPEPGRAPGRLAAAPDQHLPSEVVVELQRNAPPVTAGAIAREYGLVALSAQPIGLLDTTLHRFRIRDGRPVEAVVRRLAGDARVASAQPNFIFRLQAEAAATMAGLQYARAKLRLPEAHEITTGEGITVAVIDSGVDGTHPEIVSALADNLSALGAGPKADAHGTAIAGVIAARGNLVGAAPAVRLLAVEAFASDKKTGEARGVSTDIVRAISLVAEKAVRLANLSFGGPSDPLVSRAIAAAHRRGTIFVAAAGNGGPKASPAYPAADPNVIGVTATDAKDALFGNANRGGYIAVSAPGVDVLVPAPGKGYKLSSGTSLAAAHVTGVLALAMQRRPDLTLEEARQVLAEGARDLGQSGPDPEFGAGLVDARRSVEGASTIAARARQLATVPASP